MKKELYQEFKNELLAKHNSLTYSEKTPLHEELPLSSINGDLLDAVYSCGPYGEGHPAPLFKVTNFKISSGTRLGNGHVKWLFTDKTTSAQIQVISFFYETKSPEFAVDYLLKFPEKFHAYCYLKANFFREKHFIQLQLHSFCEI
jgi:single-stranded DNA-specific DHH superfamily exonuclease